MRLQGGLRTRRSQQQLVARIAKLAVRHGSTVIVVSIDKHYVLNYVFCVLISNRYIGLWIFHIGRKQSSILSPLFALQNCQGYP